MSRGGTLIFPKIACGGIASLMVILKEMLLISSFEKDSFDGTMATSVVLAPRITQSLGVQDAFGLLHTLPVGLGWVCPIQLSYSSNPWAPLRKNT